MSHCQESPPSASGNPTKSLCRHFYQVMAILVWAASKWFLAEILVYVSTCLLLVALHLVK